MPKTSSKGIGAFIMGIEPTVNLPLVPFSVPTEVRVKTPSYHMGERKPSPYPSIPLESLSDSALYELTSQWLDGVYVAAKKKRPHHRPKELPVKVNYTADFSL